MTVLDAYALVAFIADEPAAAEVESLLRQSDARVAPVNLAEAVDVAGRVHGVDFRDIRGTLEPLLLGGALTVTTTSEPQAWLAAELRTKHYERKDSALSIADCFLLAHALTDGDAIATSDPPLATVARAEGVDVVALPDASGKRP